MNYLGSNPVKIITRTANLYNKANVRSSNDFANCMEVKILDDNNVLVAKGKSSTAQEFNYQRGWVRPGYTLAFTANKGLSFKNGDIITISADFTLIEKGDGTAAVRCYLFNKDKTVAKTSVNNKAISETKTRLSWKFTITKDDTTYYPIFPINSNKVRIENIAIKLGEDATYEPYNQLWRVRSGALIRNPKNLLNISDSTSTNSGLTSTRKNGVVKISGTQTASAAEFGWKFPILEVGKTYTYHLNSTTYEDGISGFIQKISAKGNWISNIRRYTGSGATFTVTEDMYKDGAYLKAQIYMAKGVGTVRDFTCTPILNEGDTAEPFYVQD